MGSKPRPRARIKKPPILFHKTQRVLAEVERELGAPVIAYWNSPNGSICHNDVTALADLIKRLGPRKQVYLSIKSDGGSGEASLRLVNLLRQYAGRLTALVARECASAATMLALGADEIRMGTLAYLTAVDTSLRHELSPADIDNDLVSVSQDELLRVIRLWKSSASPRDANPYQALFQYVHPLVVGAVDRSSSLSIKICEEILAHHMTDAKKRARIAHHLNSAYPSHEYPITLREAKRVGLNVRSLAPSIDQLLLDLHELHAEMGQRALTDYDELNYHSHEIGNILETTGVQVYYQRDKDWHYRKEERRWVPMNDKSMWLKMERVGRELRRSVLHLR
jgi:hypothetical protein